MGYHFNHKGWGVVYRLPQARCHLFVLSIGGDCAGPLEVCKQEWRASLYTLVES